MAFKRNNITLTNYVGRKTGIGPGQALFSYTTDDGDNVLAPGYFNAADAMFRVDDIIVINNLKGEPVDVLIVVNNNEKNGDVKIETFLKY